MNARTHLQYMLNEHTLLEVMHALADVSDEIAGGWLNSGTKDDRTHGRQWARNATRIRNCASTLESL